MSLSSRPNQAEVSKKKDIAPKQEAIEKEVAATVSVTVPAEEDTLSLKDGLVYRFYQLLESLSTALLKIIPTPTTFFNHQYRELWGMVNKLNTVILDAVHVAIMADDESRAKLQDKNPIKSLNDNRESTLKNLNKLRKRAVARRNKLEEEQRTITEKIELREAALGEKTQEQEKEDIGAGLKGEATKIDLDNADKKIKAKIASRCFACCCKPKKEDLDEQKQIESEQAKNNQTLNNLGDELKAKTQDPELTELQKRADELVKKLQAHDRKYEGYKKDKGLIEQAREKYLAAKEAYYKRIAENDIIKDYYLTAVSRKLMFELLRAYAVMQEVKTTLEHPDSKVGKNDLKVYQNAYTELSKIYSQLNSYFGFIWCPKSDNKSGLGAYSGCDFYASLSKDATTQLLSAPHATQALIDKIIPLSPGALDAVWQKILVSDASDIAPREGALEQLDVENAESKTLKP